jgi:cobalt-zinc-cadmium efflux system membrane fusion protein
MTIPITQLRIEGLLAVRVVLIALAIAVGLQGCAGDNQPEVHEEEETWAVTAWGELYELFPEVDVLVAGETATAHTHVTVLDGFQPLLEGRVEIVLRQGESEMVFTSVEPVRPGIFNVEVRPEAAGEFELAFRIASAAGKEEIPGGRVRVGSSEEPGGLIAAAEPTAAGDGGEPLPFLKEEQWRTEFATVWVEPTSLARSVEGLARVRPPAGGEAAITAPMDAVLLPEPWPYPGQPVERGAPLFQLLPRTAADRSLSDLEAGAASLNTELATARARLARLEELLALEATSRREVEEAGARVTTLEALSSAADRNLQTARSAREGGDVGGLTLRAPLSGLIAAVTASPGAAVAAGEPLARVVRSEPRWLEVAVSPEDARRLRRDDVAGVVVSFPEGAPIRLAGEAIRLVSVSPEMEAATGTVAVLLQVPGIDDLILGTTVQAQVLLAEEVEGIVVPATAPVDDGGVTVVYLQLSGEEFSRQEVHVVARQGDRILVEGLVPGQRLVTHGGEAIRRSSLMTSGEAQGHVH